MLFHVAGSRSKCFRSFTESSQQPYEEYYYYPTLQWRKLTCKETPWSKEEALETGSLGIWGSNMAAIFHSVWMAGSKTTFQIHPKGKGKS